MPLEIQQDEFWLEHGGFRGLVRIDRYGRLDAGKYRSAALSASSEAGLRALIDARDTEAGAKAARAKALKEARENPVPAMYAREGLDRIGVRGIDQRSGAALITINGEADSCHQSSVLRILQDNEQRSWQEAHRTLRELKAAVPEVRSWNDAAAEVEKSLALEGRVTYDRERDLFVFVFEGKEYTSGYSQPHRDITRAIVQERTRAAWPWVVNDGEVVENASTYTFNKVFKTRDEARNYLEATSLVSQATDRITFLQKEFAFDFSAFTESSGEE